MLRISILLFIGLFSLSLPGCKPPEKPISKEEAARFGASIEHSVARHDPRLLDNIIDMDVFADRVAANTKMTMSPQFRNGLRKGLSSRHFGNEIIQSLGQAGTYRLLHQYEKAGRQHLVFRIFGEGGINYHDFELVKTGTEPKAADILIYYTGENLSETLGNFANGIATGDQTNANAERLKHIRLLMDKGNLAAAKRELADLPASILQSKLAMMLNVMICSGLHNQQEYLKAIEGYRSHYPDAANVPLLMIDGYFMSKDYPKVLAAVDSLDKKVGIDPFLDYFRALAYKMDDDVPQYRRCIGQVYEYEPNNQAISIEMINACFQNKEEAKARAAVMAYRANKNFDQNALESWMLMKGYRV